MLLRLLLRFRMGTIRAQPPKLRFRRFDIHTGNRHLMPIGIKCIHWCKFSDSIGSSPVIFPIMDRFRPLIPLSIIHLAGKYGAKGHPLLRESIIRKKSFIRHEAVNIFPLQIFDCLRQTINFILGFFDFSRQGRILYLS